MHQEFLPFDLIQKHPEQDWLVEGLLPLGYTAILASEPKEGKTCLAVGTERGQTTLPSQITIILRGSVMMTKPTPVAMGRERGKPRGKNGA